MVEVVLEVVEMVEYKEALRLAIMQRGIQRVPAASQELQHIKGQGYYRWQFYLRRVLLDSEVMRTVGDAFWQEYEGVQDFQLGGIETAGVPVLMSILSRAKYWGRKVNAFTVRKEPKAYGLKNWLEGQVTDEPVVLVDDLTSPMHSAFWHAMSVIRNSRLAPHPSMFVVVNKQHNKFDKIESLSGQITIKFIFDLDDLELS